MKPGRLVVVHALIAFVAAGSLGAIASGREAWPFLSYPMYAELNHGRLSLVRLYGMTDGTQVPLDRWSHWAPLGAQRAGIALGMLAERPDGEARVRAALAALARRYEDLRIGARHDGPRIEALRAVEHAWSMRLDLANRDAPEESRLIGEIRLDGR